MKYEIIIEVVENQALQEEIYKDVLMQIIKECICEVERNEKSNDIPEGIN